jgi:hypothetical protein
MNCWKNITQQPIASRLKCAHVVTNDIYWHISQYHISQSKEQTYLSSMEFNPGYIRESVPSKGIFKHDRRPDLQVLVLQRETVAGLSTESREGREGLIVALPHQQPARGIWKEEHANTKDQGRDNLDG